MSPCADVRRFWCRSTHGGEQQVVVAFGSEVMGGYHLASVTVVGIQG